MAVSKIKPLITKKEVSQTIDLKEVFGVSLSGNDALKQAIGQAIIDRIIERTTEERVDIRKEPFKEYSKEYIDSDDFKAFNKKKDEVNMTLTGNMLGTLDIIKSVGSKIKIGWEDPEENAKAYNHNVGDTIKTKRAFFGITRDELNDIKNEFKNRVKEESSQNFQSESDRIRSEIIRRLNPNSLDIEDEG